MSSNRDPDAAGPVDPSLFRRTCARFATGITVVTVIDEAGHPHGMTVNSFSSVSLEPPLVMVSIDLRNAILGHFIAASRFAINILGQHQQHLSHRFSSPVEQRFNYVAWHRGALGMPLLDGVLAHLECVVARTFEVGDHTLLLGEVQRASYSEGFPLVYFNSAYRKLSARPPDPGLPSDTEFPGISPLPKSGPDAD